MIKPIETVYNGYKFRSRLEARWAVFFDTLGVEYWYEPEGYDLGNGVYYLPDFWLPKQNKWLEVKPNHMVADRWEIFKREDMHIANKCGKLANITGKQVYLLTGQPEDPMKIDINGSMHPYLAFFDGGSKSNSEAPEWGANDSQMWCVCPKCSAIDLCYAGRSDQAYCGCKERNYTSGNDIIREAYTAARQVRFENN